MVFTLNSDNTILVGDTTYSVEDFLLAVGQVLVSLGAAPRPAIVESAPPPLELQAIHDYHMLLDDWKYERLTYESLLERKVAFKLKYASRPDLWFFVDFIVESPNTSPNP